MILPAGVELHAPLADKYAAILTPEALAFAVALQREFNATRKQLLAARVARQQRLDAGERPDFLPETQHIRDSKWVTAPLPKDLLDRRVEITGPVDRKMIINALNSGAKVFMADFEDSTTPTWENVLEGQLNLRDAVRRTITYDDSATGKHYELKPDPAVLFVRARGWHLEDRHILVDGEPMSGSIFVRAQELLGVPQGSIRATVLIETILASFEMDEILYELRDHSAGLNCGRWDYIFSFIKKLAGDQTMLLPDRGQVTMTTHFMRSYSLLCIKTCHRRNICAMGGMSALIPIKSDPVANEKAIAGVRADKEREATDGHDGTWVAHPGLVPIALEVFDRIMPQPNQISKQLPDYTCTAADLLAIPTGTITFAGLKQNVAVGLGYLEAWLRGIGCVPLFNLMEDAATAEISRAQLWQWVHHHAVLEDGRPVTAALCDETIDAEIARAKSSVDAARFSAYEQAAGLMHDLIAAPRFPDFLTLPAYDRVLEHEVYTA